MAKVRGGGVTFAIGSTLAGISGELQTKNHKYSGEMEFIRNKSGEKVTKIYFDDSEEATFTYYADASVTVPARGDFQSITDTSDPAIAGTNWLVDDIEKDNTNTTCIRITVKLSRSALINP